MGLFSTTHVHNTTVQGGGPSHVTVTEKKAPTDESIRLLNEFEVKAKNNIIEKIHINNSIVEAVGLVYADKGTYDYRDYQIKFKINGKEFIFKDRIQGKEFSIKDKVLELVTKALVEFIMNDLTRRVDLNELR